MFYSINPKTYFPTIEFYTKHIIGKKRRHLTLKNQPNKFLLKYLTQYDMNN